MRYILLPVLLLLAACELPNFGTSSAVDPKTLPPLSGREQALIISADAAAAQGNMEAAEKDYLSAIGASQGHVEAHIALAKLYGKKHQEGREREVLEKALDLQPNHPEANYLLGKLELADGKYDEALAAFQQGLKASPNHLDLLSGAGIASDLMSQHVAARNYYNQALAHNRGADLSAVRTNLGMSYLLSHEPKLAVTILKDEAAKPGVSPTTRHNLALAYGALGKDNEARALLTNDMSERERTASVERLKRYWVERTPANNPLKPALHSR